MNPVTALVLCASGYGSTNRQKGVNPVTALVLLSEAVRSLWGVHPVTAPLLCASGYGSKASLQFPNGGHQFQEMKFHELE